MDMAVVWIIGGVGYVYLRIARASMVCRFDFCDRTFAMIARDGRGTMSRTTIWRSIFVNICGYLLFCKMVYLSSLSTESRWIWTMRCNVGSIIGIYDWDIGYIFT